MKLKNTGLIIKSKLTEKFTTIPNSVLNDSKLSWKAKGILCKLLSNKSDWAVYKSQLQQFSSDGRDSTTAGFNELVERGYIVAIRRHNDKGQFAGYDYVVYDEPISEQPFSENPLSVNPSLINTNIINTKLKNTNINTSIILGENDFVELSTEEIDKLIPEEKVEYFYKRNNFIKLNKKQNGK